MDPMQFTLFSPTKLLFGAGKLAKYCPAKRRSCSSPPASLPG